MIAAWMLYCSGIALLIGAAAAALERAGYLVGRPGRWVWAGALLATLAVPLAARYRPSAFQSVAIPIPTAQSASATSASPIMTSVRSGVPPRRSFSWDNLDRPLVLLWGCLSLSLLGFFAVGAVRLRRLGRHWRPAAIGETPVLVSANLGPAVIGVVRCRLVVP